MYWYPQALLTAEQACRRRFFVVEKRRAFLRNDCFCQKLTIFDNILDNIS